MIKNIGIPQALLYHKYFPLWELFFSELGIKTVISPQTNKHILNNGIKIAENELCLPVKTFFGHILEIAKEIDCIFVPRIVSVDEDGYTCPKIIGLPDMIKSIISSKVKIIHPLLNIKEKTSWQMFFIELGKELGYPEKRVLETSQKVLVFKKNFSTIPNWLVKNNQKNNNDITVGVLSHSYLIYDPFISVNFIQKIQKRGVKVLVPEMVSKNDIKKALFEFPRSLFWNYQKEIFGAAQYWIKTNKIDGIFYLPAFPCGPDSVVGEFIKDAAQKKDIPLMAIPIDEHTAEAGVNTRIEAFLDMTQRKKVKKTKENPQSPVLKKSLGPIPRQEMVVTFPRMGEDTHLVLKDLFTKLGVKCIIPPPTTEKTIRLGAKYAPETICLPFKINLGNYIEALEKGANVLIHAGGCGPCRFGLYGNTTELALQQLTYNFQVKIIEPPDAQGIQQTFDFFRFFSPPKVSRYFLPLVQKLTKKIVHITDWKWIESFVLVPHDYTLWKIAKTTFLKKRAFDLVEKKVLQTRCYEINAGDTSVAHQQVREWIDQSQTISQIRDAQEEGFQLISKIDIDSTRQVLKIGLVGEFYMLLEPFINFEIEKWLGKKKVYLEKGVSCTDFIDPMKKNIVGGISREEIEKAAFPYLKHWVGGEGLPTIGHTVLYAKHGFDGVIHLMPFTCMPETVAKQILFQVSEKENIPVLSLVIDEHTGKAGFQTRLEAFCELLKNRKELKKKK